HRFNRVDQPFVVAAELHFQDWRREGLKELACPFLQTVNGGGAKENLRTKLRATLGGGLINAVQGLVELIEIEAVQRFGTQVVNGFDRRDDVMVTSLSQQRAIVAIAQVTVAFTEIDDLGTGFLIVVW